MSIIIIVIYDRFPGNFPSTQEYYAKDGFFYHSRVWVICFY